MVDQKVIRRGIITLHVTDTDTLACGSSKQCKAETMPDTLFLHQEKRKNDTSMS